MLLQMFSDNGKIDLLRYHKILVQSYLTSHTSKWVVPRGANVSQSSVLPGGLSIIEYKGPYAASPAYPGAK
jgi:hypothetical protein